MNTEYAVRNALVEQKLDQLSDIYASEPRLKESALEIITTIGESMLESTVGNDDTVLPSERDEVYGSFVTEVLPEIKAQFENPAALREMLTPYAKQSYLSAAEYTRALKVQSDLSRNFGGDMHESAIRKFEDTLQSIIPYVEQTDKFVNELVRVAQRDGLEVAVSKEAQNAYLRTQFPTPDAFRTYNSESQDKIIGLFEEMSQIFSPTTYLRAEPQWVM